MDITVLHEILVHSDQPGQHLELTVRGDRQRVSLPFHEEMRVNYALARHVGSWRMSDFYPSPVLAQLIFSRVH